MLRIQHDIPGRVRFRIQPAPAAPRAQSQASASAKHLAADGMRRLAANLAQLRGVRTVRLNAACASLVVHYDPTTVDPAQLQAAVAMRKAPITAARIWRDLRRRITAPQRIVTSPAAGRAGRRRRREVGCGLCRLQLRLMHGLLRSAFRCWRQQWRIGGHAARKRGAGEPARRRRVGEPAQLRLPPAASTARLQRLVSAR
jgi:hypothetical protein